MLARPKVHHTSVPQDALLASRHCNCAACVDPISCLMSLLASQPRRRYVRCRHQTCLSMNSTRMGYACNLGYLLRLHSFWWDALCTYAYLNDVKDSISDPKNIQLLSCWCASSRHEVEPRSLALLQCGLTLHLSRAMRPLAKEQSPNFLSTSTSHCFERDLTETYLDSFFMLSVIAMWTMCVLCFGKTPPLHLLTPSSSKDRNHFENAVFCRVLWQMSLWDWDWISARQLWLQCCPQCDPLLTMLPTRQPLLQFKSKETVREGFRSHWVCKAPFFRYWWMSTICPQTFTNVIWIRFPWWIRCENCVSSPDIPTEGRDTMITVQTESHSHAV